MNVVRNETRTGLLVVLTLAALVGILIYLGAPGAFTKQKTFSIYFDNAAGIKLGTPVMLAGRRVGQVIDVISPVPVAERPPREKPEDPSLEVRVIVQVEQAARIYRVTNVRLASFGFLDEPVIDFTAGVEGSGLAEVNMHFVGERPGGLADTGTLIIEKIEPAINQLVSALKSFDSTATNLTNLTDPEGDLANTFTEFRALGKNVKELTGPDGSLQRALKGFEKITAEEGKLSAALDDFRKLIGPDSNLAKALANAEKFTAQLSGTDDVPATLKNFRAASTRLNTALAELQRDFGAFAKNLEQASETVKRQPWRLIWPSTKKYPEDEPPKARPATSPPRSQKRPLFRPSGRD